MTCANLSHSPRLHGGTWSCPECATEREQARQARAAAESKASARHAATMSRIPPHERETFVSAVRQAAVSGVVRQNDVRPLIRGLIYHKHVGSLWSWATSPDGFLDETGRERSTDTEGRNAHHDAGVYHLRSAA